MTEARWPNTTLDVSHPTLAQVQSGSPAYVWSHGTADVRALQILKPSDPTRPRIAAAYNGLAFDFPLSFTDGNTHQVALYMVDYDSMNRSQTVQVIDNSTSNVISTQSVSNFSAGAWLVYDVTGSVTFHFICTGGINAVLNGIFIDGAATSPTPTPTPTPAPTAPSVADSGFETIAAGSGNYLYNPTGDAWTFSGHSGVSANGSALTSGNPNAPEGAEVGFLQLNDGDDQPEYCRLVRGDLCADRVRGAAAELSDFPAGFPGPG